MLVAIVLMVASFAGGVAYEHDGPDRAPAVTTVQRDAPAAIPVTAVRHPSERELVALKS